MMQAAELPAEWRGRLAVVTLPEEIDMSNGAAVQEGLLDLVAQRPETMVVDMSATTFCDSAGVRAVMLAHRQAAAGGCGFRLVIFSPAVRRVFTIIGADQLTSIYSRLASALGADGSGPASA